MTCKLSLSLLLPLIAAAGCGGADGGDDDQGDADDGDDGGDGDGEPIVCEPAAGEQTASGVVRIGGSAGVWATGPAIDGILSTGTDWQFFALAPQRQTESARAGDCVLFEWEPSLCDPACEDGICHEGECSPFPELVSAGTLTVDIDGDRHEVSANAPTYWGAIYRSPLQAAPEADALVTVCAAGDQAGGFGAELRAVEPLTGALPDDVVMELVDGGDLEVTWDGSSDARVRLTLAADNMAHGLPWRAILECDTEDDGSLAVPQELIESFPRVSRPGENYACSGTDCPTSTLVRYRAARIDEPDLSVEVRVESAVHFWVEH
jgi:hypothetical protein